MKVNFLIAVVANTFEEFQSIKKIIALHISNAEIFFLESLEELKNSIKSNKCHLVICDQKFHSNTALDVVFAVKNLSHDVPIIVLGESESKYVHDNFIKLGAQSYLPKQELNKLGDIIKQIIEFKQNEEDSTEKKLMCRGSLIISPEVFTIFYDDAPIGICITSPDGRLLNVNSALAEMLNYTKEELIGKNYTEITHPDDIQPSRDFVKSLLEGEKDHGIFEKRYLTKNKETVWAIISAKLIRDEKNNPMYFLTRIIDITEKKINEVNLKLQSEIIENVDCVIGSIDEEYKFVFWNKGAQRITGWNEKEVLGQYIYDLPLINTSEWFAIKKELEEKENFIGIVKGSDKTGNKKIWQGQIIKSKFSEIRLDRYIILLIDITELKNKEEQLLRSQRLESIGVMASGIAHDLNNCMTPLRMGIDILKLKQPDEDCLKILNSMEKSLNKGLEMVSQILKFTRGVKGEHAPVNVNHIINDVKNIIDATFPPKIKLKVQKSENLWNVIGDLTQIHQVIVNLCVNARDAMPEGGVLTITSSNVFLNEEEARTRGDIKTGHYVCIKVSDTGCGIKPEILPKIFEPFFSTKEEGKGTGLGLFVTKTIVRDHGGEITVKSKVGEGTEFEVYLPADPRAVEKEAKKRLVKLPKGNGETILFVEDNETVMAIAKTALESANFKVLTASDGAEGVYMAMNYKNQIQLIIADLSMPIMDGTAMIKAIRRFLPDIPIIVASGLKKEILNLDLKEDNICAFLNKPYTLEELLGAIGHALKIPVE